MINTDKDSVAARFAQMVPVHFEFRNPTAKRVCIAGSFNGWNPVTTPTAAAGHGHWVRELWLPPSTYEYLFIVDGVWMFDPSAEDYLPNIFGGMNAVIEVISPAKCQRKLASPPLPLSRVSRTRNGNISPNHVDYSSAELRRSHECARKPIHHNNRTRNGQSSATHAEQ